MAIDLNAFQDRRNWFLVGDGDGVYGRDWVYVLCPDCKKCGEVSDDCELCHGAGVAAGEIVKEVIDER